MSNFIMKYSPWEEGLNSQRIDRLFEFTDDSIAQAFAAGPIPDLAALQKHPSLFVQEDQGQQPQFAKVGRVLSPRIVRQEIEFEVVFERAAPPIAQSELHRLSRNLHIQSSGRGLTEFNRSHWAVKDVDLYRVLLTELRQPTREQNVFRLPAYPQLVPRLVSVMMPFSSGFDAVYHTIQAACAGLGLACARADDIWQNQAIIDDVASLIDTARVVVFDCSGKNPNVFYELGLAHAWGKEVIILTSDVADIPFDLRHIRCIPYQIDNLALLATQLSVKIREVTA